MRAKDVLFSESLTKVEVLVSTQGKDITCSIEVLDRINCEVIDGA